MLGAKLPNEQTDVVVQPSVIEVVLAEEGAAPLSLISPPFEDLSEINAFRGTEYSLKDIANNAWDSTRELFVHQLDSLKNKSSVYGDSPTYLNRLANWAELAGKYEEEEKFLKLASQKTHDYFFSHKLGENLINQHRFVEAEKFFSEQNLETDMRANLRLAYFHTQRKNIDGAMFAVKKAISIDPLDFSARLFEGALYLINGFYRQAINSFRIAEEERPNSSALHANKAIAYHHLGKIDKALTSLRRSVALDPLNANAIALLADLAFSVDRNEDAVPSLRFYLSYEQKSPLMWSRLARAFLALKQPNEAITALRRQASIENSSSVWNNMGITYHASHSRQKAYEAFKYAMNVELIDDGKSGLYAARNLSIMLAEDRRFKEALAITKVLIEGDKTNYILQDNFLSDIYSVFIISIANIKNIESAIEISEKLLTNPNIPNTFIAWLVSSLIGHYALIADKTSRALYLTNKFDYLLTLVPPIDVQRRDVLINNISFACAEIGNIPEAEKYLGMISHRIHIDCYPTATLGLIHLRKGNTDRGMELYEEAGRLARSTKDKSRIKQKLNFELAKLTFDTEKKQALRYIQKVLDIDDGSIELIEQSKKIRTLLLNNK